MWELDNSVTQGGGKSLCKKDWPSSKCGVKHPTQRAVAHFVKDKNSFIFYNESKSAGESEKSHVRERDNHRLK